MPRQHEPLRALRRLLTVRRHADEDEARHRPPRTLAGYPIVARIRFAVATPYGAALDTIIELGFHLADPCYERQPKGAPAAWHPMGRELPYAATHALIVMTPEQSSTQWARQAQTSAGAVGVDVDPKPAC